ncbi:hypothetical protein C0992_000657 [Termitomyces sp. T32_za158]|nr:hypothetical protein C0992_000655 [Termitomyces sp. T32_za158]KAG6895555.1 hypothetical protein C0992_000657 [Termitomyces sp. T32_za158]
MELVEFPAGVPACAEAAQLIFMAPIVVPVPAAQFDVVIVATDPRTPAQYDGLMAEAAKTAATSKGKQRVVPTEEDDSDYGQSSSEVEEEEEEEEGETPAQRFQRVQRNKKLAKKKGIPCTPYELERLYKYCANPHVPHHDRIAGFMLLIEMRSFAQHLDTALQDRTMRLLLDDPVYWDLPNPITRPEDMAFVKRLHIPARFLRTKDDGTTALHVMCAPDPKKPFDLEQIAQYALIYGQPGLENTWQGIAVDFAYRMHWRTLFGFALCRALCANSAGKTTLVCRFALVMARPGLYREAVAAYAAANLTRPFVAQYGADVEIRQVHVPDDQVRNFSDDDALHVLIHNRILPDWVDHAYMYGMVYLEQQFHQPTMSLDVFRDVDDERLQRLSVYGTPPAIPHWDGWREISEEDRYRLLFKHTEEVAAQIDTEGLGLYYIGMDPNVGQLWKRTPAHSTMPVIGPAINVALTDSIMVDTTAAEGPSTPLKTESTPQPPAINITQPEAATMMEAGGAHTTTGTG